MQHPPAQMKDHQARAEHAHQREPHFEPPIYPTNAFRFLEPIGTAPLLPVPAPPSNNTTTTSPITPTTPFPPLKILIIGAGLAGLSTAISLTLTGAHTVTVHEQAPTFAEVGAGIQVPPNSTRHLHSWGVTPHITPHISEPHGINIRRYDDGRVVGETKLRPDFREKYGGPYWVLHRADYHAALLARALELGVKIEGNREVISYDCPSDPSRPVNLTFKNGTTASGDLVIAADGVKSHARTAVLRSHGHRPIDPVPTSQAAYRCTIPLSVIAENPITSWIADAPNQNLWFGPGRHTMTYPIGGPKSPNRLFNLVLSHPETRPPHEWPTNIEDLRVEMHENFRGFEPRFREVLRILSEHEHAKVVKWPIVTIPKLPTWIHSSNRLLLLGDAAHAMVPYMSQGAAVAVEDAAAIATALSLTRTLTELPRALRVFERVRMQRCHGMQQASCLNGEIWHLDDGEEQRRRDEGMGSEGADERGWSANQWSDPVCQGWAYGYDAVGEIERAWVE